MTFLRSSNLSVEFPIYQGSGRSLNALFQQGTPIEDQRCLEYNVIAR
jgi:hypothetical protein